MALDFLEISYSTLLRFFFRIDRVHIFFKSNFLTSPFLQLSENDLSVNSNHNVRPVVVPKSKLILDSIGYAEVMNAGKSRYNEDQSCIFRGQLWPPKVIY